MDQHAPNEQFLKARNFCKSFYVFRRALLLEIGIDKSLREKYDKEKRDFGFCQVRKYLTYRTNKNWYRDLLLQRETLPRFNLKGREVKNLLPLQQKVLK